MADAGDHEEAGSRADAFLELLRGRRTISNFLPEPVPAELLDRALDAGRFAPNHKLTEPWRFTVLGPETRLAIAGAWSGFAVRRVPESAGPERREQVRSGSRAKWLSKPTVVVVSQVVDADPARREEDYAAVACAMHNVQLAAWALGFGCQWSTNPATSDPDVLRLAGIPDGERVVGFLFAGFPAEIPESRRTPLELVLRRTP